MASRAELWPGQGHCVCCNRANASFKVWDHENGHLQGRSYGVAEASWAAAGRPEPGPDFYAQGGVLAPSQPAPPGVVAPAPTVGAAPPINVMPMKAPPMKAPPVQQPSLAQRPPVPATLDPRFKQTGVVASSCQPKGPPAGYVPKSPPPSPPPSPPDWDGVERPPPPLPPPDWDGGEARMCVVEARMCAAEAKVTRAEFKMALAEAKAEAMEAKMEAMDAKMEAMHARMAAMEAAFAGE